METNDIQVVAGTCIMNMAGISANNVGLAPTRDNNKTLLLRHKLTALHANEKANVIEARPRESLRGQHPI